MCGRITEVYPMYGDICAICLDGSDFLEEVVVEEERPDDTEDGGSGNIGEIFDEWLGNYEN